MARSIWSSDSAPGPGVQSLGQGCPLRRRFGEEGENGFGVVGKSLLEGSGGLGMKQVAVGVEDEEMGNRLNFFELIDEEAVLVHPFYYAALHPDWRKQRLRLTDKAISQGNQQVGTLYFDLDRSALVWVQAAIGLALGLIVLVGLIGTNLYWLVNHHDRRVNRNLFI